MASIWHRFGIHFSHRFSPLPLVGHSVCGIPGLPGRAGSGLSQAGPGRAGLDSGRAGWIQLIEILQHLQQRATGEGLMWHRFGINFLITIQPTGQTRNSQIQTNNKYKQIFYAAEVRDHARCSGFCALIILVYMCVFDFEISNKHQHAIKNTYC